MFSPITLFQVVRFEKFFHKQADTNNKVKMADEQVIVSKAVTKAVADVTRVAIQAMATATAQILQSAAGPKIGRPAMKQPTFN